MLLVACFLCGLCFWVCRAIRDIPPLIKLSLFRLPSNFTEGSEVDFMPWHSGYVRYSLKVMADLRAAPIERAQIDLYMLGPVIAARSTVKKYVENPDLRLERLPLAMRIGDDSREALGFGNHVTIALPRLDPGGEYGAILTIDSTQYDHGIVMIKTHHEYFNSLVDDEQIAFTIHESGDQYKEDLIDSARPLRACDITQIPRCGVASTEITIKGQEKEQ